MRKEHGSDDKTVIPQDVVNSAAESSVANDRDIRATLAFIQRQWSEAHQAARQTKKLSS